MSYSTETEFTLPKGYVDSEGNLHKTGTMRLATAGDEIHAHKDMRSQANPAYVTVILLSKVITRLGTHQQAKNEINPLVIESLTIADFKYLMAVYQKLNEGLKIEVDCPKCSNKFEVDFLVTQ
jgi:hypothetical protein